MQCDSAPWWTGHADTAASPTLTSFMRWCVSESLPGLWKCCILGPEECVCGMLGVCGVGGVCELCVRLVWTVEPGDDPPGDRFSSHSLDSL